MIKNNFLFCLSAIAVVIIVHFGFRSAGNDELRFLLRPTAWIISLITNSNPVELKDAGYYFDKPDIIIEKSCSGINFLLLCFITFAFLSMKFFKRPRTRFFLLPASLVIAYIVTLPVNASRILISIAGQKIADQFIGQRPHLLLHVVLGTFIHFFFLILLYLTLDILFQKLIPHHEKINRS